MARLTSVISFDQAVGFHRTQVFILLSLLGVRMYGEET